MAYAGVTTYCTTNPCANGGVCYNNGTGASCLCPAAYTGATCATPGGGGCIAHSTCTCAHRHGPMWWQHKYCFESAVQE